MASKNRSGANRFAGSSRQLPPMGGNVAVPEHIHQERMQKLQERLMQMNALPIEITAHHVRTTSATAVEMKLQEPATPNSPPRATSYTIGGYTKLEDTAIRLACAAIQSGQRTMTDPLAENSVQLALELLSKCEVIDGERIKREQEKREAELAEQEKQREHMAIDPGSPEGDQSKIVVVGGE